MKHVNIESAAEMIKNEAICIGQLIAYVRSCSSSEIDWKASYKIIWSWKNDLLAFCEEIKKTIGVSKYYDKVGYVHQIIMDQYT